MIFRDTPIAGVQVIELEPISDDRGSFARSWCAETFASAGLDPSAVQMNIQMSHRAGTIRGMHRQVEPHSEDKLVRCIQGSVFDVAVDTRPGSPTYLQWFGLELSADNGLSLFVPKGCAHGLQVLADNSKVLYVMSAPFVDGAGTGYRWDDPALAIDWPITSGIEAASRDNNWPLLNLDNGG